MFQALLCPSSGARDYNVDYHIGRLVLELLSGWKLCLQPERYSSLPSPNFNLQQLKNETTNGVINIIFVSSW